MDSEVVSSPAGTISELWTWDDVPRKGDPSLRFVRGSTKGLRLFDLSNKVKGQITIAWQLIQIIVGKSECRFENRSVHSQTALKQTRHETR